VNIHLETERLVIREFTPEDLQLLMDLDSDPEVVRFLREHPPKEAEHRELIHLWIDMYPKHAGYGYSVAGG
jgi:RimJ/RimL family protein N-acetyltransferase